MLMGPVEESFLEDVKFLSGVEKASGKLDSEALCVLSSRKAGDGALDPIESER